MHDIAIQSDVVPAMSDEAISKVGELERLILQAPQTDITTWHLFHGGVYTRTIKIPAGNILTGALIKIATTLIICGDVIVYLNGEATEFHGYHVMAASARRKQAFIAKSDVYVSMIFSTDAKTVEDAEKQFTDDFARLMSCKNQSENHVIVTGE